MSSRPHRAPLTQMSRNPLDPRIEFKWGSGKYATRKHAHREFSVGLVIRGSTQVWIADHEFHISPGAAIAIPPGVPHLCRPDQQEPFQFCMLYLEQSLLLEMEVRERILQTVQVGPLDVSRFIDLGRRLISNLSPSAQGDRLRELRELLTLPKIQAVACDARIPLSAEALAGSTADLGRDSGQSRYQRFRSHKQKYGLGQQGVRQIQRIEFSKQMLRQGASVATAATECGFFDQSHYVKTFRMYTGLRPSQYRAGSHDHRFGSGSEAALEL